MIIKKAEFSDLEKILLLQKLAYKSEAELYEDFSIPPLVQTLKEVEEEFENHVFLKVVENEKIIGSVRAVLIDPKTCYIGKLIVHPEFQNRGIGTELIREIERIFKDCEKFELITGHKSKKNLKLYKKLGYKEFKTERLTENLNLLYLEKINL